VEAAGVEAAAAAAGTGRDTMVNGSKARVCAPHNAQVRRDASWPRQKSYIRLRTKKRRSSRNSSSSSTNGIGIAVGEKCRKIR